jgi:probable F420-dependent oxidoreductase
MGAESPLGAATVSVWGPATWLKPEQRGAVTALAAQLEALGCHRLWIGGGQQPGVSDAYAEILRSTSRMSVASGILNFWINEPGGIAEYVGGLDERFPGRFLLGIGNSHAPIVQAGGQRYDKPYSATVDWLDRLDAVGEPAAGRDRRVLAALGPRMLRLAADRSIGAHPYFSTVEHTRFAREVLGNGPLLAPEVAVVLETDPDVARRTARAYMSRYLVLPNYTNNLRRFGWDDDDFVDGGSDNLVDALIPWGNEGAVAEGLRAHVDAGADELVVQALPTGSARLPTEEFRRLLPALLGSG